MAQSHKIMSITGIEWKKAHPIPEESTSFLEFINSGEIAVGDYVTVEDKDECSFPLGDDVFCLTFEKDEFFIEEPFTLSECKILFGNEFKGN